MQDVDAGSGATALAEAQHTIARLETENAELRSRLADERRAEELGEALRMAGVAGTLATPMSHLELVGMIVDTAEQVIGARSASLALVDEETQELVFAVALGRGSDEMKNRRMPLGQGVAGLVALMGQPMALSDASHDARESADISAHAGFAPDSLLCVPLAVNDQVIGVIELLDKKEASAFTSHDMQLLALFASLAAVAIQQSRTQGSLRALVGDVLASFGASEDDRAVQVAAWARGFAEGIEAHSAYRQAIELAELITEIGRGGERELRLCQSLLQSMAEYTRSRPQTGLALGIGR